MRNKKYIYTFKTRLGGIFVACADNKKELGRKVNLDLVEIISREKNAMHYLNCTKSESEGKNGN